MMCRTIPDASYGGERVLRSVVDNVDLQINIAA